MEKPHNHESHVQEKGSAGESVSDEVPTYDEVGVEINKLRMGEASDLYGDIQTAEDYGYVSRG